MPPKKIDYIFRKLEKEYPNPRSELKYKNKFTFLLSVILSAQSTDVSVNKATKELFKVAKNPDQILELGEKKLKNFIKTIGLYNSKAKNIILLSKLLKHRFNYKIPTKFENLIKLPGVGKKTASVYQNEILRKPKIAVDTHVFRVSNRIGLVNEKNTDKTQEELERTVPLKWKLKAHSLLIFHGRRICKSQKPNCKNCTIQTVCLFSNKHYS